MKQTHGKALLGMKTRKTKCNLPRKTNHGLRSVRAINLFQEENNGIHALDKKKGRLWFSMYMHGRVTWHTLISVSVVGSPSIVVPSFCTVCDLNCMLIYHGYYYLQYTCLMPFFWWIYTCLVLILYLH